MASHSAGPVERALAIAPTLAEELPFPGEGDTPELWRKLADLGGQNLCLARALEPHLDARNILREAESSGISAPAFEGVWGVYAAEGPGMRVRAVPSSAGVRLEGVKPWCSLADRLDRALVTAWVDDHTRGLFAVDLHSRGIQVDHSGWVAKGLSDVPSGRVEFSGVPAVGVGEAEWYLRRPGFAWGAMGVAAIWYGAARAIAARLRPIPGGREPDQIALLHLGECTAALHAAGAVLEQVAVSIDEGEADGPAGWALGLAVRAVVAQAAETTMRAAEHGLGPAPLALEAEHAARVADLHLYLRQWHAERDLAALGQATLDSPSSRA